MSLPILKQFNKVGGIVYGLLKSFIIIYIVLSIVFAITYITGNITMSEAISESYITKIFVPERCHFLQIPGQISPDFFYCCPIKLF